MFIKPKYKKHHDYCLNEKDTLSTFVKNNLYFCLKNNFPRPFFQCKNSSERG